MESEYNKTIANIYDSVKPLENEFVPQDDHYADLMGHEKDTLEIINRIVANKETQDPSKNTLTQQTLSSLGHVTFEMLHDAWLCLKNKGNHVEYLLGIWASNVKVFCVGCLMIMLSFLCLV